MYPCVRVGDKCVCECMCVCVCVCECVYACACRCDGEKLRDVINGLIDVWSPVLRPTTQRLALARPHQVVGVVGA